MRNVLLTALMFVLLSVTVSALECQYTVNETYKDSEEALVLENSLVKYADVLSLSDFTSGEESTFNIYNPNDFEIHAKFIYYVSGHGEGKSSKGLKLAPNDYTLFQHYCYDGNDRGYCSIVEDSIDYFVIQPEVLYKRQIQVIKTREICKNCVGVPCLNDGVSCDSDSQCGSEVCNIAGKCGHIKVVDCSTDMKNCNDVCLTPSLKKYGEPYSCEWECESGEGKDGICKIADMILIRNTILFLSLTALILAVAYFLFWKGVNEKEQKRKIAKIEKLEREIKRKEEQKRKLEKLKTKSKELDLLTKEIEDKTRNLADRKEEYKKERQTPYTNLQGYLVIINENGYEVFANNHNNLFHRWWYKHHYGKIEEGFEIHHKNFNKRDNKIENLAKLSKEEHREIHRRRYD